MRSLAVALAVLVTLPGALSPAWAGPRARREGRTPTDRAQPADPFLEITTADLVLGEEKVTTGRIKSVADAGRAVTLEDGTVLLVPRSAMVRNDRLERGKALAAYYLERGAHKVAISIEVRPGNNVVAD